MNEKNNTKGVAHQRISLMPQSLSQTILHIVFSVKNRERWIDTTIRPQLYAYLAGTLRNQDCYVFRIGGTDDHVHVACSLPRTMSQADLVKLIKHAGSEWIKSQSDKYQGFHWQRGYGCFSVSFSSLEAVVKYIDNQQEHHKRVSFQDEFRMFLTKHGLNFDEEYVWD